MSAKGKHASIGSTVSNSPSSLPVYVVPPRLMRIQDAAKDLSATTWQIAKRCCERIGFRLLYSVRDVSSTGWNLIVTWNAGTQRRKLRSEIQQHLKSPFPPLQADTALCFRAISGANLRTRRQTTAWPRWRRNRNANLGRQKLRCEKRKETIDSVIDIG